MGKVWYMLISSYFEDGRRHVIMAVGATHILLITLISYVKPQAAKKEGQLMIELDFPNPVRDEKNFYGRKEQLARIEHSFISGTNRPVLILGERRIGKTSLQTVCVKRLAAVKDGNFVPLFLPPASAFHSLTDFAKEISQSLCSHLGQSLLETDLVDENRQFQLTSFGQFIDAIAQFTEAAPDKTFIICVDEFDAALINCGGVEAARVLGLIDYLIGKSDLPINACFTMTHLPESVRGAYQSPILTSDSEMVELFPFSQTETQEMVDGLLENQVRLADSAMERLFQLSGGHPYFIKLLLNRLLESYWSEGEALSVTEAMMEGIIQATTFHSGAKYAVANIYNVHFNRREQELVMLLAQQDGGITAEELRSLGMSLLKAAKGLERRGYLARGKDGCYDFRIEFLGWWLRGWEEYDEQLESLNLESLKQKLAVEIEVDEATRQVRLKGKPVKLTQREYQVLTFLCHHSGRLVTKDQLAQALWPEAKGIVAGDETIDTNISRLRRKLKDNPQQPRYIETVTGQGFILHRAAFARQPN